MSPREAAIAAGVLRPAVARATCEGQPGDPTPEPSRPDAKILRLDRLGARSVHLPPPKWQHMWDEEAREDRRRGGAR
jgi:hypothetical protein